MARIKVFISGPYTITDPVVNTRTAVKMWHTLWRNGFAPFCPHLNMLVHFIEPIEYEDAMEYCFEYIHTSDCLIRIPGMSEGADREVDLAIRLGLPVFHSVENLCEHYRLFSASWTDTLFSILHECQNQAARRDNTDVEKALDEIKKEFYYSEVDEKEQLKRIAALAISALSRLD